MAGVQRTSMSEADASSVWVKTIVGWHTAFWLMLAIAITSIVVGDSFGTERLAALGTLAVLAVAYLLVGARAAQSRQRAPSRVYLAVMVVAVGGAIALTPDVSFLLFIAFPQAFFFSDTVREGGVWAFGVAISATVGFGLQYGFSAEVMRDIGPQLGVSLLFSLLLGVWISRVIDQSQQRAELIAELERTKDALAEAHHSAGVVAERERMAAEIHDTLAQGFTSIIALAQAARAAGGRTGADALAHIESTARENLAEARGLVAAFAPVPLADSTLAQALHRLAERFTAETGVDVGVETVEDPDTGALGRDGEVVLLRAAQEALANVRRHARARHVVLRLTHDAVGGAAALEVTDDGSGFDPATASGFGLAGMRHRVEDVGGGVDVDTAPGQGTRVLVRVPLAAP
jgi:signal transduction histidine kinase